MMDQSNSLECFIAKMDVLQTPLLMCACPKALLDYSILQVCIYWQMGIYSKANYVP